MTMGLKDQLDADLKEAMKAGDALKRDTLRMVIAALKNKAIEVGGAGTVLDDAQVLSVVMGQVKSRTDSAEQYDAAGRTDLAEKERAEIGVLQGYLPRQLTEDETLLAVRKAIEEVGATSKADLGKVIKVVMAAHRGEVDGKLVQGLIARELA